MLSLFGHPAAETIARHADHCARMEPITKLGQAG